MIKPHKCSLFRREIKLLSHIVPTEGIATDPDKIKAVQKWKKPNSERDVRSFLGLDCYYRRYVPSFYQVAKPLSQCLGDSTKLKKTAHLIDVCLP